MTLSAVTTAYHEAGHATITSLLWGNLDTVTIIPDGDVLGRSMQRIGVFTPKDAWRNVLITMAGPIAEQRYLEIAGDDVDDDHAEWLLTFTVEDVRNDAAAVWDLLDRATGDDQKKSELFDLAFHRTRQMIFNKAVWRAIDSIAVALVERHSLERFEVDDIVMRALKRSVWHRNRFNMSEAVLAIPDGWEYSLDPAGQYLPKEQQNHSRRDA